MAQGTKFGGCGGDGCRGDGVCAGAARNAGVALARPGGTTDAAPFGHACKAQDGVRVCPSKTLGQRVPTFDGVPLDADVTLPASGAGPFPTIVMLHGWSGASNGAFGVEVSDLTVSLPTP